MAEIHKWHGFKELEENLKLLGAEMHEKGVKRMMSRAAVAMRDDARRRAPVLKEPTPQRKPGTIRENIRIWRKRATQYAVTYYVGVRALSGRAIAKFKSATGKASTANPDDPFFWRFMELGVPSRGIAPRAFLRKAFESQKMRSVQIALEEGSKFIRQIRLKRLRQRSGP